MSPVTRQVMARPQEVPYKKADVACAFRMFADKDAPPGCISPEQLEKALVRAWAGGGRGGLGVGLEVVALGSELGWSRRSCVWDCVGCGDAVGLGLE